MYRIVAQNKINGRIMSTVGLSLGKMLEILFICRYKKTVPVFWLEYYFWLSLWICEVKVGIHSCGYIFLNENWKFKFLLSEGLAMQRCAQHYINMCRYSLLRVGTWKYFSSLPISMWAQQTKCFSFLFLRRIVQFCSWNAVRSGSLQTVRHVQQ